MAKSAATFSIETEILEASRKAGINMSAVCEEALRNQIGFSGDPEKMKEKLQERAELLKGQLNQVEAQKEKIGKAADEKLGLIKTLEIARVLKAWHEKKCQWAGVQGVFQRQAGFKPSEPYINELLKLAEEEGLLL